MAAVAVLMAAWWITDAIPLSATALLPLVMYPVLGIMKTRECVPIYVNNREPFGLKMVWARVDLSSYRVVWATLGETRRHAKASEVLALRRVEMGYRVIRIPRKFSVLDQR